MNHRLTLALFGSVSLGSLALAQRAANDWMTNGNDAQRSHWVRVDAKINRETMAKPGFELVWKMKMENSPRQLNSVTPPSLLDFYIGYRGFRALGFFGTANDKVIGVDLDLAKVEWEKKFTGGPSGPGTLACPGGLTSAVTRPTAVGYPPLIFPRGFGRGTPAKSGVGAPHEGAVTIRNTPPQQAPPPRPAQKKGGPPPAAAPSPFSPRVQWAVALSSDGKLHRMYVSNGEEPIPAVQFLPPGANAVGLVVFDNTAYVSTTNNCNGVDNGVWSLDIESGKVNHWKASGNVAGNAGPAFGPEGTIYAVSGDELVALNKDLTVKATYKGGVQLTSTPVIFEFKGKDLIAVTAADGTLHLLDAANLSSPVAKTSAFATSGYQTGALASWQEEAGTRWVLAPAGNSVVSWKVVENGGSFSLEKAWASRTLTSPLTPVVVNGVVFALSSGEFRTNDDKVTAAQRAQRSTPAVLYAIDGVTGKELWSSGKSITSFVHSGGLAADHNMVFVAGHDGTQYSFSFPMEH